MVDLFTLVSAVTGWILIKVGSLSKVRREAWSALSIGREMKMWSCVLQRMLSARNRILSVRVAKCQKPEDGTPMEWNKDILSALNENRLPNLLT